MEAVWFAIVSAMLAVYVVLDGFDFGVGIVHRLVARTDQERRTVLAAIGPVWDGNEVWLIAAGGVLFMAFPKVYATAFSGFYLALMIVLWLLILRGVAIEFRSHQDNPLWREFWDTVFSLASALLAVVFGTSLGNLVRGVPLGKEGLPGMPLFTNFLPGREPGILDWYTGLVGLFTLVGPGRSTAPCTSRGGRPGPCGSAAWPLPGRHGRPCSCCGSPRRPPPHGCGPRSSPTSSPAPGPLRFVALRSPGPGGRSGFRGAAGSSRRSSPRPRSCSGWWPRRWRAIPVLAAVDPRPLLQPHRRRTRPPTRYGLGVALAWWAVGIALVAGYFTLSVPLDAGEGRHGIRAVIRVGHRRPGRFARSTGLTSMTPLREGFAGRSRMSPTI